MEEFSYADAKILVVDDVEEVLKSTKNSLVFEGMNVECMSNPIDALEYLKNNHVDVLLLDFFMPEINGDVFVRKLREFNNETIIILRTGYSDQVPSMKMIDNLNIQGYMDKLKGEDELIIMTKSAIKTAFLTRKIKEQNEQIEYLNYKNNEIGRLISQLASEAGNQVFSIGAALQVLNEDKDYEDLSRIISKANVNLQNLLQSLRFETMSDCKVKDFEVIVKELLKARAKIDCIDLRLQSDIPEVVIPNNVDVLILIMLEIYYYIKDNKDSVMQVNTVLEEGKIVVTLIHNNDFNKAFIDKLKVLADKDEKLTIKEDNFLKVVINV